MGFTRGTAIRTPCGEVLIEGLRVGDLVCTLDNGPQRLIWIGTSVVSRAELRVHANLAPVHIQKDVLGNRRKLMVSRQHAMLVGEDHRARAIHLRKSMRGIDLMNGLSGVTFIHLMFEAHDIIFAEGMLSESFYPGPHALALIGGAGTA